MHVCAHTRMAAGHMPIYVHQEDLYTAKSYLPALVCTRVLINMYIPKGLYNTCICTLVQVCAHSSQLQRHSCIPTSD